MKPKPKAARAKQIKEDEERERYLAEAKAKYEARYPPLDGTQAYFNGYVKADSIDWKRFDIPGISFFCKCSTCGGFNTRVAGDYISYPAFGKPIDIRIWCEDCFKANEVGYNGHTIRAMIVIQIIPAPPKDET